MRKMIPTLMLGFLALLGVYVSNSTHESYLAPWLTDPIKAEAYDKPHNLPTWRTHGGQAGCASFVDAVLDPTRYKTTLVVTWDGELERMSQDEAWHRVENKTWADDVWAIGVCE